MKNEPASKSVSRREFSALIAAGGAVPLIAAEQEIPNKERPAPGNFRRPLVPDTPVFENDLSFTRKDIAAKAEPFPMTQVRLLPGTLYYNAQEWNRGYMSRLPADRLLYTFRANAGLEVGAAKPLGGWEQPENGQRSSELRGHFCGHFLSASAQLAANGDRDGKAKGDYLVAELAKCQEKLGGKYLSAFPTSWFERLERCERVWAPFYTYHKIMAGMFDMYQLAGNRQALAVLEGMAACTDEWSASKSFPKMQEILKIEFGGISETLYNLAAATNNHQWAKVGDRFQKRSFVEPLAARRDELRGLHANTHIPQAIAAARRYEISGDTRFHDVADFFFDQVTNCRSYVTAGTSNAEAWLGRPRQLAAEWKLSVNTAECCCAYNMLKLARHIYAWKPCAEYFDYYERSLLNHRIGSIRPEVGFTQYYLSLAPGAWKTFGTEDQTFWCCTGSGVEEYSKLNDSIYWRDGMGIYVNLFVPSELDWREKGFKIRQQTRYPEAETVTLKIDAAPADAILVRVRIPGWLQTTATVKLNGKVLEAGAAAGGYLTLNRVWKVGDEVELRFPMHLHVESMPDDSHRQAILYGPLVLAGDLGGEGLTKANIIGANLRVGAPGVEQFGSALGASPSTPAVPQIEVPTLRSLRDEVSAWIKSDNKPLTFQTTGQKTNVSLVPLNALFDRRYNVYWEVS